MRDARNRENRQEWTLINKNYRLKEAIKEPFVKAMLILCLLVAVGILYSDAPSAGHKVWKRYFAFLIFIPYFAPGMARRCNRRARNQLHRRKA